MIRFLSARSLAALAALLLLTQPAPAPAQLIHDVWKREVFAYGGANWVQVLPVFAQVNSAQQFAPLQALLSGGDPQKAQARAILRALTAASDKVQVPEVVIGFRLGRTE